MSDSRSFSIMPQPPRNAWADNASKNWASLGVTMINLFFPLLITAVCYLFTVLVIEGDTGNTFNRKMKDFMLDSLLALPLVLACFIHLRCSKFKDTRALSFNIDHYNYKSSWSTHYLGHVGERRADGSVPIDWRGLPVRYFGINSVFLSFVSHELSALIRDGQEGLKSDSVTRYGGIATLSLQCVLGISFLLFCRLRFLRGDGTLNALLECLGCDNELDQPLLEDETESNESFSVGEKRIVDTCWSMFFGNNLEEKEEKDIFGIGDEGDIWASPPRSGSQFGNGDEDGSDSESGKDDEGAIKSNDDADSSMWTSAPEILKKSSRASGELINVLDDRFFNEKEDEDEVYDRTDNNLRSVPYQQFG